MSNGYGMFPQLEGDAHADALKDLQTCRARIAELERQLAELRGALPEAPKLRMLALWIGLYYPDDANREVQQDLNRWADAIEALGKE